MSVCIQGLHYKALGAIRILDIYIYIWIVLLLLLICFLGG